VSRKATPAPAARWAAVSASVRGSSHDRSGLPNQDAVEVRSIEGHPGRMVAAVADGHGGQRYVRSAVGSELAVATAGEVVAELLGSDRRIATAALLERAAPLIVERWRAGVEAHVARNPFLPDEHVAAAADLTVDPPIAYGSTLILAVLGSNDIGLLQIGDGDALVVGVDGSVVDPVPGDERLVGGETTSLCLPTAVADARSVVVPAKGVELLVLSSDGYGNSFASPEWRADAGAGFLEAVRRDGLAAVGTKLEGWLADSAQAGGDDVTMVVAHLDASAPAAAAAAVPPTSAATAAPKPATDETRGSGRKIAPALLVGLLVGLVVGGVVAWLLKDDGSTATATEPVAVETETSTTTSLPITLAEGEAWIVVPGKVVAFDPGAGDGEVSPRVVLEADGLTMPEGLSEVPAVVFRGAVIIRPNTPSAKPIPVEGGAAAVRVIDDTVWVAAEDGRVRSYELDGDELLGWQDVQVQAQGATDR